MIGIILWSDATAGKAVIWCEDQGDLAFYTHVGACEDFQVRVGDWVAFELKLQGDLRLAFDIQVLQEPGCPSLAEDLSVSVAEGGGSLRVVEREDQPRDWTEKQVLASDHADSNATGSVALLPQTNTTSLHRQDPMSVGERNRPGAPNQRAENVIAFPTKGDGGRRRA